MAVGDGRFRVIVQGTSSPLLYDVRADPTEMHDLASTDPDRVRNLLERERAFVASHASPPVQGTQLTVEEGARKARQGLGYTEGGDSH